MKKLISLFVFLISFSFAAISQTAAYTWANKGLILRSKPSQQSEIIQKIAYGSQVDVLDTLPTKLSDTLERGTQPLVVSGNWLKISYSGKTGYAFGGYVSKLKPQQPIDIFADALSIEADSNAIKTKKWPILLKTSAKLDGSVYEWYADGEGCWSHRFVFPGITLNDALMLMNEEIKTGSSGQCTFNLTKIADGTYTFGPCVATTKRILKVTSEGISYYTEDCD